MELVGPSGKSISGSNKHILKLMIDQTFGHFEKGIIIFLLTLYTFQPMKIFTDQNRMILL
jgi:hypothetical protein